MPTKKTVAKKSAARKVVRDPRPMPEPEPMPGPSGSAAARVVYLAGCRNCHHIPLGVNALVSVLVAIIFTLSAMLMAASVTLNGQSPIIADSQSADSVAAR